MDDRKHAVCEGLSGSTRSAATLYQRASLRITPDKSRKRTCSALVLHLSGKRVTQDLSHVSSFPLKSSRGLLSVSEPIRRVPRKHSGLPEYFYCLCFRWPHRFTRLPVAVV